MSRFDGFRHHKALLHLLSVLLICHLCTRAVLVLFLSIYLLSHHHLLVFCFFWFYFSGWLLHPANMHCLLSSCHGTDHVLLFQHCHITFQIVPLYSLPPPVRSCFQRFQDWKPVLRTASFWFFLNYYISGLLPVNQQHIFLFLLYLLFCQQQVQPRLKQIRIVRVLFVFC